ncbi:type II toxin-antitoxin system VapC family toxin [Caballeronia sp.]|uniref:type II toxin-antitoxin system VapC family toxin n=1 Tax=Caballeronia sp. TaxID=1931223 RepID=UPI003C5FDE2A
MYLIDTNVISELRKGDRTNQGVRKFFRQAEKHHSGMHLSVVTIGELRRGLELIRHRGDDAQTTLLEAWMTTLLNDFALNVIGIDEDVAQLWGRLRVPHPENELDKLIAATALIHDLTVATRNVKDFASTGVRLVNPFE